MNAQKILGLILLILGLAVISYSLFNSYNIFTDKSQPPTIFKIAEKKDDSSSPKAKTLSLKEEAEKLMEEKLQEQFEAMMPVGTLPKLLDLISWSILAGILIFGGTQIASLGIKLIKK